MLIYVQAVVSGWNEWGVIWGQITWYPLNKHQSDFNQIASVSIDLRGESVQFKLIYFNFACTPLKQNVRHM